MASIKDEIKETFKSGDYLTKVIYVNTAVFLVLIIFQAIFYLFKLSDTLFYPGNWLVLPSNIEVLLKRPWTIISYMFVHEGFRHFIINIIMLYFSGRIFMNFFNQKSLLSVYLLAGICGGALYVIAYNAFPLLREYAPYSTNRGASAAIMGILLAAAFYKPNEEIHLLLISSIFGPIRLIYIAMFLFVIDIANIPQGENIGGQIAHIGGAIYGMYFGLKMKKGQYVGKGFEHILDSVFTMFKPRKKLKVTHKKPVDDYQYNAQKAASQAEIDRILDKISKHGYDSLTKSEKEILFKMGK